MVKNFTGLKFTALKSSNSKFLIILTLLGFLIFCTLLYLIIYMSGANARFLKSIEPISSFTLPKSERPDYLAPRSWALYPETKPDGAWETPWGVDVFFIHGTTSASSDGWNTNIDNVDSKLRLQSEMLPNFAGPFQKFAPVYAPLYRQVTLHGEYNINENSQKAFKLAFDDIDSAFQVYMETRNQGRAIILVGVGQGGLYARRLLKKHFQTDQMQNRLVATYLIESPTSEKLYSNKNSPFEICTTDEQTGCIASWNTINENDVARTKNILSRAVYWDEANNIAPTGDAKLICFNPSMGNTTTELIGEKLHRGSVNASELLQLDEAEIVENAISSQCVNGFLVVSHTKNQSLNTPSNSLARMLAPPYNLFYSDLAHDAAKRARITSAWLDKYGAKPAPPLPPIERIEIAPINKIEKILGTE